MGHNTSFYMPFSIPDSFCEDPNADFILSLSHAKQGLDSMMVIFDCFSKMTHFSASKRTFNAVNITRLLPRHSEATRVAL